MLLLNFLDTAATSQDGSSLEFIAAIAGRQCYILDASGRGLCTDVRSCKLIHRAICSRTGKDRVE